MAAMIAAIGLSLLVGIAGQLSLAHAFFVAIGAYGYAYLAEQASRRSLALIARGAAGRAWRARCSARSPAACAASTSAWRRLGLVFLGQHILQNATGITGGYAGIAVPPFSLFGFEFSSEPDDLVDPRRAVRAAGAALVPRASSWSRVSIWYGRNLVRSRPGRALATLRDSEVAAGTNGHRRRPLQGGRVHRVLDVRRARRRADGARVRAHRAGVVRLPAVASTSW